jgi:hypothetical protein
MKSSLTTFCFIVSWVAIAQGQTTLPGDSLYMVTYSLGPKWESAKKPSEQNYFKEHSAHLSSLRKAGTITFGARYADKGMIFISTTDFNKAKELITTDVAIQNGLFTVDIQRMKVFYPFKE